MITARVVQERQYRLARYYLGRLRAASVAYARGHENSRHALALFDQEWPQIKQWWNWSVVHMGHSPEAARLCIEYPEVGDRILRSRHLPQERIDWHEQAVAAARLQGDVESEAIQLYLLAAACEDRGQYVRAKKIATEALARVQERRLSAHTARCLILLGDIAYRLGEDDAARRYFTRALALAESKGSQEEMGHVLKGLGLVAWKQGDWVAAREYHSRHLEIARKVGQEVELSDALINLSLPLWVLGERERARELVRQCIDRCRAIRYDKVLASALHTLGQMEHASGEWIPARMHFEEAIALCRDRDLLWDLHGYLLNLSILLLDMGEPEEALRHIGESIALARAAGVSSRVAEGYASQADIYRALGKHDEARSSVREALLIARHSERALLKINVLLPALRLRRDIEPSMRLAGWVNNLLELSVLGPEERDALNALASGFEALWGWEAIRRAGREEAKDVNGVIAALIADLTSGPSPPIE